MDTRSSHLPACPFVAGPPIRDPRLFVGRKPALDMLTNLLTNPVPHSVNIWGERRIGKTSLVIHFTQTWDQRLPRDLVDRYVVSFISLQGAHCETEQDFYATVRASLLGENRVRTCPSLQDPWKHTPLSRRHFRDALRAWRDRGIIPVLCLDEFEELLEHPDAFDKDFFDNMRSLMQEGLLVLVVASYAPIGRYARRGSQTSRFFNDARSWHLKRFSWEEARDLVRLPASTVPGTAPALGVREQQLALKWGDRHPYLLQAACRCLWEAAQEGRDETWAWERFRDDVAGKVAWHRIERVPLPPSVRIFIWDGPRILGHAARRTPGILNDVKEWVVGIVIVVLVALAVLGRLPTPLLIEWGKKLLGIGS